MIEILRPLIEGALLKRLNEEEKAEYQRLKEITTAAWDELDDDEKRVIAVKQETMRDMLGDFILGFFRKAPMKEKLTDLPEKLDHPSKITSLFIHHFKYEYDDEDYWQTPLETWHRRLPVAGAHVFLDSFTDKDICHGDCDDYARFAAWVLGMAGFKTQIFTMYKKGSGHATCLIDMGEEYWTVGTFNRVQHQTKDLDKVAQFFYPDAIRWNLYDQSEKDFELKKVGSGKIE